MIDSRKIMQTLSFCGLVFLGFLLLFENRMVLPAWLQVAGRGHTMFLHFPIVLLMLVLLAVLWNEPLMQTSKWKSFEALTVGTTVTTAILGLLLSREQTTTGTDLLLHKWSGTILALITYLFCFYRDKFLNTVFKQRITVFLIFLVLTITGHWGGTLTHGEGYLTGPFQTNKQKTIDLAQAQIFKDVVQPILTDKCGNCHKASVMKGGLSLEDSLSIFKGGKNGKAIVAGQLGKSLLYQRLVLPMSNKKHMPLAEKPQLTADELALMVQWIKSGAPFEELLIARPNTDSLRILSMPFLEQKLNKSSTKQYDFPLADLDQVAKLNNNNRVVKQMGLGSPALAVSFFGRNNYSFDQLKELKPVAEQIVHLNLAKMPVDNNQLEWLNNLENLEELNLNYTDIDNANLKTLSGLKHLTTLSLVGTKISMKGLDWLTANSALKNLYVWNTQLTVSEMKHLQKKFPHLLLETGFQGADTMVIPLNQPVIVTAGGFFKERVNISLKHVINDVELRYTLNGKEPDSASTIYRTSFFVDSSFKLMVKAYKKGWFASKPVSSQYFKAGLPIAKATLITAPDPKYALHADKILIDLDAGDPGDFGTRALGYQKNDAIVVLDMGKPSQMHSLKVLNLQNLGAYIFPPVQMQIFGSNNLQDWKSLSNKQSTMPEKLAAANTPFLTMNFPEATYRYLKFIAKPIAKLPEWHPGKGQPGWFFMSELVVN
jgi:hypothetical protein